MHLHGLLGEVDHVLRDAAVLDGELHDRARVLGRHDDLGLEVGLLDVVDAGDVGQVLGASDLDHLAVGLVDVVVHRGAGRDQRQRELALQALLDDLHVEQPQKSHAEAEAQRHGGLGRPRERGVVHAQLLQGVAQVLVVLVVYGEDAGVDHRLGLAISWQRLRAGAGGVRERVAHAYGLGVLEARDDEADLADAELAHELLGRALDAHAVHEEALAGLHHLQLVALLDVSVEDAHRGHHATVLVEVGVQDEGLERRVVVAGGRRDEHDDGLEQVVDALARLAGDAHGVVGRDGEVLLDLLPHAVGLGARQVDLVDRGHDVEVRVHREVGVGDGLRLHALRGVHHQHRALARREAAGDLVGEVHVARRVDEVELVGLAVVGIIGHADGVGLDRDAALPLDVHRVQQLGLHVALLHRVGELEDAVRDGRLAVVDVRNDREVADMCGIGRRHEVNDSEVTRRMLYSAG